MSEACLVGYICRQSRRTTRLWLYQKDVRDDLQAGAPTSTGAVTRVATKRQEDVLVSAAIKLPLVRFSREGKSNIFPEGITLLLRFLGMIDRG